MSRNRLHSYSARPQTSGQPKTISDDGIGPASGLLNHPKGQPAILTSNRSTPPASERDGYNVIAVQNTLTSLAADVATTKRVIDTQRSDVVAVGHSYGGAFLEKYPTQLGAALRPDTAGFVTVDRAKFHAIFAQDVPIGEARVMAAQKQVIGEAFASSVPQAAWRTTRSWYMVASGDRAINPELQRYYAKRMGAAAI